MSDYWTLAEVNKFADPPSTPTIREEYPDLIYVKFKYRGRAVHASKKLRLGGGDRCFLVTDSRGQIVAPPTKAP